MKIITKLVLVLIMLPSLCLATTFCLQSNQSIFKAKKELETLLIEGEDILVDSRTNCLIVAVKEYRRELINKFMSMNYRLTSNYTSSQGTRRSCKIRLKKVTLEKLSSKGIEAGTSLDIRSSLENMQETSSMDILLMEGKAGTLSLDNNSLKVMCRRSPSGYELGFSLMASGSTMISSEASIQVGQWLNVGSISRSLNNRRNKKSTRTGIDIQNSNGQNTTTYFLTVVP